MKMINKNRMTAVSCALALAGFTGALQADYITSVYTCEMEDGKKMEDVQALNSQWL